MGLLAQFKRVHREIIFGLLTSGVLQILNCQKAEKEKQPSIVDNPHLLNEERNNMNQALFATSVLPSLMAAKMKGAEAVHAHALCSRASVMALSTPKKSLSSV